MQHLWFDMLSNGRSCCGTFSFRRKLFLPTCQADLYVKFYKFAYPFKVSEAGFKSYYERNPCAFKKNSLFCQSDKAFWMCLDLCKMEVREGGVTLISRTPEMTAWRGRNIDSFIYVQVADLRNADVLEIFSPGNAWSVKLDKIRRPRAMAMRRMKRALSLRDRGKEIDDSLSELAEQLSLDVNGKEGDSNGKILYYFIISLIASAKWYCHGCCGVLKYIFFYRLMRLVKRNSRLAR